MEFQAELTHTLERAPSELIDSAWIEQTLQGMGKASIWRRKLTAEHVVWLVIRLALLFTQAHLFVLSPRCEDRAFPRVGKHLALKYPQKKCQSVA
jgi:hypothetical protein